MAGRGPPVDDQLGKGQHKNIIGKYNDTSLKLYES